MTKALLSVKGVNKSFGSYLALKDVDLDVEHGEFIAMLGPSGCGKTTLLRSIAGFLQPDRGEIRMDGQDVTRLPPNKRPVNTVFQSYALFPHLKVLDNVAYGPRRHGVSRADAVTRAKGALELVALGHLAERFPRELSGGQQQRVALARALVNQPKLLLLDEPLSALDAKLRKHMQIELKHLQQKLGISFVFVTHDQEEAMTMADRIVVMSSGRIEQIGRGDEIYRSPRTRFVADFVGEANFIACVPHGNGMVMPVLGSCPLAVSATTSTVMIRPECLSLSEEPGDELSTFEATVEDVLNVGPYSTVMVRAQGQLINIRSEGRRLPATPGASVTVSYRLDDAKPVAD